MSLSPYGSSCKIVKLWHSDSFTRDFVRKRACYTGHIICLVISASDKTWLPRTHVTSAQRWRHAVARCRQPPKKFKIQELKKIQTGKKVDTHRAHLSTLAHKLWKCASRHVNNGWRSGFVFKRRNNICEIWRLRKAHTQSIHVGGELSRN